MKPLSIVGVLLLVLGLAALAYERIPYTTRETVIDIGPVHATAERHRTLPIPPVVAGVVAACGVLLLVMATRQRA